MQNATRWNNYKKGSREDGQGDTCMQQHLFNHFCTPGHCGFLKDVSLTFIDKTDLSDLLKREDYWRSKLKGTLSDLRQFLATKSHLKMMKNAFYFTSKVLFVLKILSFCHDILAKVNFKLYGVTA